MYQPGASSSNVPKVKVWDLPTRLAFMTPWLSSDLKEHNNFRQLFARKQASFWLTWVALLRFLILH